MALVTATLLRRLIDSGAEQPVLYLNRDAGELDVWTGHEVDSHDVVITKEGLLNWLSDDWTPDEIADYLPELQDIVDNLTAEETP